MFIRVCSSHTLTVLFPSVPVTSHTPHLTPPHTHFPSIWLNPIILPAPANKTPKQPVPPSMNPSNPQNSPFFFFLVRSQPHRHSDSRQPVSLNTQTLQPTCCSGLRLNRGLPDYALIACLCLSSCLVGKNPEQGLD